MLAKYEDTESERKTGKAQTREKLMRLWGQRGSMANRERFREPDGRKCCDWKYESGTEKRKGMVGKCDGWRKTEEDVYEKENLDCGV